MRRYTADLHVHSCLSPCAELEMTPRRILAGARERGIEILALTDHNSVRNAAAAVEIGREMGITVLPGMEATTSEEAHVLGLFGTIEAALRMQEILYRSLPGGHVSGGRHWQAVVNAADEVDEMEDRVLLAATDLSLGDMVEAIRRAGGLAIASHIDREAFSVMSQLGFVPEGIVFDAVEVIDAAAAYQGLLFHPKVPMLRSSDAHHVGDIGRRTTQLLLEAPTFDEVRLAIRGEGGRAVESGGAP